MRAFILLSSTLTGAAILGVACGDREAGSGFVGDQPPAASVDDASVMRSDASLGGTGDGSSAEGGTSVSLSDYRLDPPTVTLDLSSTLTTQPTTTFKAFAKANGSQTETDVTAQSVFYLAVNPLLGTFAANGPVFSPNTSLRGGDATVRGRISNGNGVILEADATLSVRLTASLAPGAGVPANADAMFTRSAGTTGSRKPVIVYPSSGAMLPPNLGQFELHFKPGETSDLFEVTYQSASLTLKQRLHCAVSTRVDGGCVASLDQTAFDYLAQSNRGRGTVKVSVNGTSAPDTQRFESELIEIQFAESDVRGALYYWWADRSGANDGKIMRTEFGLNKAPEVFLQKGKDGINACIGCHALSRDGKRMVASTNSDGMGSFTTGQGAQVLVPDLSLAKSDAKFFAKKEDPNNRVQFAAFNPSGDRFVGVYGNDNDQSLKSGDRNKLWMFDGATGDRISTETVSLAVEPSHVAWSPDGNMIAFSAAGIHSTNAQRPKKCGVSMITKAATGWGAVEVVVPQASGKNRFNPDFSPESNVMLFSESNCPGGDNNSTDCDGEDDPSSATWATKPVANATAVKLANAAAPSIMDGQVTALHDTFARSTPYVSNHNGGKLFWVTVSSRRREGLRNSAGSQQLWMFAVDPAKVLAGVDGSYKPFFLPFQDLTTSNHFAQWAANFISETSPVPTPPPPAQSGPPEPPPR